MKVHQSGRLTCSSTGTGAILNQPLIVAAFLERQYGGAHGALTAHGGQAHDIRHAAQLQHFALANEALVVEVQAQLQIAGI